MHIITVGDLLTIYAGILLIKKVGSNETLWFGCTSVLDKSHPYKDLEIQRLTSINKGRVTIYVSDNTTNTNIERKI